MPRTRAYSLIELSVVLIVIGALIGIIIGSQKLVENAENKKIFIKMRDIQAGIYLFVDSFEYLPGDFNNATTFFASCVDDGLNSCNGNGNGVIDIDTTNGGEMLRAFEHLSYAELIEGQYSGLILSPKRYLPNINVPGLFVENGIIRLRTAAGQVGADSAVLFTSNIASNFNIDDPLFSSNRVLKIDIKFDDGFPLYGQIRGYYDPSPTDCYTDGFTYKNITTEIPNCNLYLVTQQVAEGGAF